MLGKIGKHFVFFRTWAWIVLSQLRPYVSFRRMIMLVLSRKEDESVVIDGGIRVTVLEVKGSRVRLGIEAPQDVPICRSELLRLAAKPVVIGPFVMSKAAGLAALAP
jgi:carbon storage regulator CsrA